MGDDGGIGIIFELAGAFLAATLVVIGAAAMLSGVVNFFVNHVTIH